jgi:hypothetical protein
MGLIYYIHTNLIGQHAYKYGFVICQVYVTGRCLLKTGCGVSNGHLGYLDDMLISLQPNRGM